MKFGYLYSQLLRGIAYGPWGPLHRPIIQVYKKLYGIEWDDISDFKKLGDFFLREVPYSIDPAPIVSPAEAKLMDGPLKIQLDQQVSVKGHHYHWTDFREIDHLKFKEGTFWNFYLAPKDYHWVHIPTDGKNLEGFRHKGHLWPVNALGRKLQPNLYTKNERVTFRWKHEEFGQVIMICIGAMGVSGLHCDMGPVSHNQWTPIADDIKKGQRILGFKLGSAALLLVEKAPSSLKELSVVRVGNALSA